MKAVSELLDEGYVFTINYGADQKSIYHYNVLSNHPGYVVFDSLENDKKNKARMLLQIHDELIFECLKKDEEQIKKIIKDAMVSVSTSDYHMFSIPLEVSINSGNNWGEAH